MGAAFEQVLQAVEIGLPELLVEGEPVLRGLERLGVEADHAAGAAALALDEGGALEDVEVLGDGGEGDGVGLGELADGLLAADDVAEEGAAGGIGEGVEDRVEAGLGVGGGGKLNHMVECSARLGLLSTVWLNIFGGICSRG